MDVAAFRLNFPEFGDVTKYTADMIAFWQGLGEKLLNEERWGEFYSEGLQLFVAHQIALAAKNASTSSSNIPGTGTGILSGKSVGGVSINYDTSSVTLQDAGNYNMTQYGRQFWQLAQIVGTGGQYVI